MKSSSYGKATCLIMIGGSSLEDCEAWKINQAAIKKERNG